MIWRFSPLVYFIFLLSPALISQSYNFRVYNEEAGFPEQYVYGISQDREGLLYIATGEGLSTFDGEEFKQVVNAKSLGKFFGSVFVDSKGGAWMGQNQNGFCYLFQNKLRSFNHKAFSDYRISSFAEGIGREIWFGTAGAGLWKIDSLMRLQQVFPEPRSVNALITDKRGNLLVASGEGLDVIPITNPGGKYEKQAVQRFSGEHVRQICARGKSNEFWVLSEEGIFLIGEAGRSYQVVIDPLNTEHLQLPEASCIGPGNGGAVWVGIPGTGLRRIDLGARNTKEPAVTIVDKTHGLKSDQIQQIFRDREGNLWFGSFGDGLIEKPLMRFSYFGSPDGITETNISAVLPQNDTMVWIGSKAGLAYFNRHMNRYRPVAITSSLDISCLSMDDKGVMWIGTNEQGLYTYDRETGRLNNMSRVAGTEIENVNYILSKGDKTYVCTNSGLFITAVPGEWEWLSTNEGLLHNNIKYVLVDSKGRLWIGSHGAAPYYIKNKKVVPVKNLPGLSSYNVNSYAEDKKGNIWIATEGDGLFEIAKNEIRHYTSERGLYSNYCNGVHVNRNNSVWVTHRGGISEKKGSQTDFRHFTKAKGLRFADCNKNTVTSDANGNLWIGSTLGLLLHSPSQLVAKDLMPETKIIDLSIEDEVFTPEQKIKKSYGRYTVKINFRSVLLADPAALAYRYRLLDADTVWKTTNDRFVILPELSDGHYIFEVSALNTFSGRYDEDPARIEFRIMEPVWRSWWFYLVLLTSVVVATYTIIQVRTRNLKQNQQMLELKVKQKTFLLQREKDAVEAMKIVLEEKNKDITDSINYAKKIQDSILPPEEVMNDLFGENYFVFFRPKDIVSGDFYWAAALDTKKTKEKLALAAVVDCTGHGVPGAFLSIMANDFLRQSIVDDSITRPDQILDFLNEKVSSHLNQTGKSQMRDGMDIALVAIDHANRILYFSGANNPVYIYRRNGTDLDEIILTATKQAIGMVSEETIKYASRAFRLREGDRIFLFSDGFADQFGGPSNKKLTYKRFREYLTESFDLSMEEQLSFLRSKFEEWIGDNPQTDDVCVMAIRIQ